MYDIGAFIVLNSGKVDERFVLLNDLCYMCCLRYKRIYGVDDQNQCSQFRILERQRHLCSATNLLEHLKFCHIGHVGHGKWHSYLNACPRPEQDTHQVTPSRDIAI